MRASARVSVRQTVREGDCGGLTETQESDSALFSSDAGEAEKAALRVVDCVYDPGVADVLFGDAGEDSHSVLGGQEMGIEAYGITQTDQ